MKPAVARSILNDMSNEAPARPYIGGQAVLEGVMMRSPTSFAIVVRRKDGSLVVRERGMSDTRTGFRKLPFVRGIHSLVESLRIGNEALRFSADHFEADYVAKEGAAAAASTPGSTLALFSLRTLVQSVRLSLLRFGVSLSLLATDEGGDAAPVSARRATSGKDEKKGGGMALMGVMAVLFMYALPQFAAEGLNRLFHLDLKPQSPAFQVVTGVMKLTIVISYLLLLRRVTEVKRMFQYHGAEHKTITTYEAQEALTVENARKKTTLHARCGTTFLVMIAIVSICFFTLIGAILPPIATGSRWLDQIVFFAAKLPFLPLMAGATFELQRLFARYCTTGPLRVLLLPGFLVQKITTVEPDDSQLEVALASLRVTLFRENGQGRDGDDVRFPDFASLSSAETLRAA